MAEKSSRTATLLVICTAHFLMPFMMSAVGVALPAIGREFKASAMQLGLVETTYVLSASIFLLAMGRMGDIYGRRRVFQIGLIAFTCAGGLLSQAWSIESLIGLRFTITTIKPWGEKRTHLDYEIDGMVVKINVLVNTFGWRAIFYLVVPLGLITFAVSWFRLRGEWAESRGEPFDWQGSLIYAVAILMLITGASNLDRGHWAWALALAGMAGIALFLRFEAKAAYPVLDVALLRRNRVFAFSNLAALLNYAATFGVTFFLSLYLQFVKGMNPREAGTLLIIQPIIQALFSPFCGRLADRFPAPLVATIGMSFCALGLAIAASISAASSLTRVVLTLITLGLGFALFSSPNISVIMGSIPSRYLGVASGLNSTMRTLGMMASMTVITIIFSILMGDQAVTPQTQPQFLVSMHTALLTFSGLCVIGIFLSLGRLRDVRSA
ncbi:MAG: MFS transporter [Desulfuromonadales bacterium]